MKADADSWPCTPYFLSVLRSGRVLLCKAMLENDHQLLERYLRSDSEDAFSELVRRHLNLVWSTAQRITQDAETARDVSQVVFKDFAQKARWIPRTVVISGWLYRATCMTARKAVRSNLRRIKREEMAMEQNLLLPETSPDEIGGIVDELLLFLRQKEREIVVLRFLEQKTFAEAAEVLGISEEAAQKRLSRALEILRRHLKQRGLAVSSAALPSALSLMGSHVAPESLAAPVAIAAMGGANSISGFSAVINAVSMIPVQLTSMKVHTTIAAAVSLGLIATPLFIHHHATSGREVLHHGAQVSAVASGAIALGGEEAPGSLEEVNFLRAENETLKRNASELLRLRGEVSVLRDQLVQLQAEHAEWMSKAVIGTVLERATWSDKGNDDPRSAIESFLWAWNHQHQELLSQLVAEGTRPESLFLPEYLPIRSVGVKQQWVRGCSKLSIFCFGGFCGRRFWSRRRS
jgi:RNA polymerase sigma factor (sigma-70 family)